MSKTLEKQAKTDQIYDHPFDPEIFRMTFNRYVRKFNTISAGAVILISLTFAVYGIALYLEMTKVDITGFLHVWEAGKFLLLDELGLRYITEVGVVAPGIISIGIFSCGIIAISGGSSCGIIAISGGSSCGIIAIGGIGSCGLISIASTAAVGFIAISTSNAYGFIAISIGYKYVGTEQYTGKAVGFIAIGRQTQGFYTLSYDGRGEGIYQLSPKRQDPKAVTLFISWFRKFKNAFVLPS